MGPVPEERYETLDQLRSDLEMFVGADPSTTARPAVPPAPDHVRRVRDDEESDVCWD